ncbi:MAG: GGDEF domain-containing protein [Solirubrobacterales bacterium]
MAGHTETQNGAGGDSAAGRLALKVSAMHADLIGRLRDELGADSEAFAEATQRLAVDFGGVTASAVDAAVRPQATTDAPSPPAPSADPAEPRELASLYHPGHMRRRLEQLVETNRRYGHPFGLAVFDASGPDARNGGAAPGPETVLSVVGAALRESIRVVDEVFRLEEDAICVLAPNLRTVEGMQMAERLLGQLEELERAGGLRITIVAGVVACPEHGSDAEELLRKADAAMWRARAVGQPVGVGALQDR